MTKGYVNGEVAGGGPRRLTTPVRDDTVALVFRNGSIRNEPIGVDQHEIPRRVDICFLIRGCSPGAASDLKPSQNVGRLGVALLDSGKPVAVNRQALTSQA